MPRTWKIVADWESLDEGSDEERSCFAALGIQARQIWLTEGHDALANRLRRAPLLSAYHLAEWLAWNWWRLRWEPRTSNEDWRFAHKTSNIGNGYIWPNITIFSDGERTALIAKASKEWPQTSFRYINNEAVIIPSSEFEAEVDDFLEQVLGRLESTSAHGSNLRRIWEDVCVERRDPELARARKFEALLGTDPDESNNDSVIRLTENAATLGVAGVEEIAADQGGAGTASVPSVAELSSIAGRFGFNALPTNMVKLSDTLVRIERRSDIPAWKVGAEAARVLRRQEHLADAPIRDVQLTDMLAAEAGIIEPQEGTISDMSFALDLDGRHSKIVLRSKWHAGRRFELARLLGDRLISEEEKLYPATRAFTYRQKAQRSFAAELLSPFDAVMHMLQGDYSLEKQLDVAAHFKVSELTVRTQLVNHKILEREDLDAEAVAHTA
jgi:hypothetical protein